MATDLLGPSPLVVQAAHLCSLTEAGSDRGGQERVWCKAGNDEPQLALEPPVSAILRSSDGFHFGTREGTLGRYSLAQGELTQGAPPPCSGACE